MYNEPRKSTRLQSQPERNYNYDTLPDIYDVTNWQKKTPTAFGDVDLDARLERLKPILYENGFHSLLDAALTELHYRYENTIADGCAEFISSGGLRGMIEIIEQRGLLSRPDKHQICTLLRDPGLYQDQFEKVRAADILNQNLATDFPPTTISSFSFDMLYSEIEALGPDLLQLCRSFAEHPGELTNAKTTLETKRQLVIALAGMAYNRSERANFLASMFSIYLYASRVPQKAIETFHHLGLCVSRRTLGRILDGMAGNARRRLRMLGPSDQPIIIVFDNLTVPSTVRYARLHNHSEFLAYTAGYTLVPPPSRRPPRFLQGIDIRPERVRELCLNDFLLNDGEISAIAKCFRSIVINETSWCANKVSAGLSKDFSIAEKRMPLIYRIDTSDTPAVHPLPTYDCNESVINEVIDLLNRIRKDINISDSQCQTQLFLFCGDLLTVGNIRLIGSIALVNIIREAQKRQSVCSPEARLTWIEPVMGLLHLQMAVLSQIFKNFYGKPTDGWSIARCIVALGREPGKLWSKSNQQVKDYNGCKDLFDIVFKGCIVALVSTRGPTNTTKMPPRFENVLPLLNIMELADTLATNITNFGTVSETREETHSSNRNRVSENLFLFIQHGMMLQILGEAIREGDSGRIMLSLKYFAVWFQGTSSHKYAKETIRLIACIKRVWSPALVQFWKDNCVAKASGSLGNKFVALDELNEHLVCEVKSLMGSQFRPETTERLRNVLSLLVWDFKEIKRKMGEETEMDVFDNHATPPNEWYDVRRVARIIIEAGGLVPVKAGSVQMDGEEMEGDDEGDDDGDIEDSAVSEAVDFYAKGCEIMTGKVINELKDKMGRSDVLYPIEDEGDEICYT